MLTKILITATGPNKPDICAELSYGTDWSDFARSPKQHQRAIIKGMADSSAKWRGKGPFGSLHQARIK